MSLPITAPGSAALKSFLDGSDHVVVHAEDAAQRTALLAALAALDPDAGLAAIVAALGGLATSAQLATLLGQTDAVEGSLASILAKLIAAPSTEAKQDTIIGHVDGIEAALAAVLAKIIAAPATEAKQDAGIAATALIGTRAYGTPLARVAVGAAATYSAAISATEVLVHASSRCFIQAVAGTGTPAVTSDAIPLEVGEKFTLRLTSGQRIGVIRDTADGFLNIVPVA